MSKKGFAADFKSSWSERVVRAALAIPRGRVTTYGRLARAAGGGALSAQSVTSVLAKAWHAGQKDIPFHRIVYADGRVWLNSTHRAKRLKLYKQEGIEIDKKSRIKNFPDIVFDF
jgi:alkylated DNA nucleotide flippase Atl1